VEGGKILLVDDVPLTLEIARSVLSNTGCRILTASNGKEALNVVKRELPHLVLMDIVMPEMNGDECCKLIKEDPSTNHIPVILLSSASRLADLDKETLDHCNDILKKPFGKAELLEKIQTYLDIKCRKDKRILINTEVAYIYNNRAHSGRMLNISNSGMFIKTEDALPVGSKIDIAVINKENGFFEVTGKVIWTAMGKGEKGSSLYEPGMGIKFLDNSAPIKEIIDAYSGDVKVSAAI